MEIGVWVALGYFTQAIGLETSDASVYCACLCSLSVVVVPLLDAVTGKGIKRVTVAASFLALVGTGFLELGDAHASWNDLWCVAQAVGFGVAFTRIEFPGKSLQLSIEQLISVAALTGIWCIFSAGGHLAGFSFVKDPQILAALSYTGLVTTSLAIWLETVCLEKVPAAEMSVIFSTEPLWATLVSALLLKETMGPNALVGAGVILLACLVAQSEQISELVGMGEGKGNDTLMDAEATDAEEGAEEPFQLQETEEVNDDDFPSSVLDEMVGVTEESDSESSFRMSMVQESTVPGGVYGGDPAFAGEEGTLRNNDNDVPAAAPVGWFGSYGKHEEMT
ncbi:Inner membrane transport protein yicL [Ectocarpus siliculosus]|uniref:Inner membrane transport protein yicL n=1 Tax=Ectocarpus siliculosus TaxID=2880 RepID=D7G4P8_ECTSI|nr:Inner membrane transport protein yicL [Ectocarpus siliculosus]|eukprot:CBJ33735.1 Inner membrane transport protein yicL [Ectocarpus siliculosus]